MFSSIYFTLNGKTNVMPDYFSHDICARIILEKCNKKTRSAITNSTLFYLGAQGGDVFFTYKLNFGECNLGKRLHGACPYELFKKLAQGNISYACGFATHYATDCLLHPTVNAYCLKHKSPLSHLRFEADLGLFISRKFGITRHILPYERIIGASFALYDCIKIVQPQVTLSGVERCLKRHFALSRGLLKTKRTSYNIGYDFSSLSAVVDDAIELGVELATCLVEGKVEKDKFLLPFCKQSSKTLS